MMDGRIKTLHPVVHAGILARRDKREHLEALQEHGLGQIDLVCCNLYPFLATIRRPEATFDEAVEHFDTGGPGGIRATVTTTDPGPALTGPTGLPGRSGG